MRSTGSGRGGAAAQGRRSSPGFPSASAPQGAAIRACPQPRSGAAVDPRSPGLRRVRFASPANPWKDKAFETLLLQKPADPRIRVIRFDSESGSQLSQVYGGAETPVIPKACAGSRIELCVTAHRTLRGGGLDSARSRAPGAPDSAQKRTGLGASPERAARIELCAGSPTRPVSDSAQAFRKPLDNPESRPFGRDPTQGRSRYESARPGFDHRFDQSFDPWLRV